MARQERENFPVILNKLNDLNIPVTWATVGHLFLDSCERTNGKAHDDMPRPGYFKNEHWRFDTGDWYDIDPCGNYKTHPEFYAPDLIGMILDSNIKHEIGCHSFSHCDFSERNSSPELIEAELQECGRVMKRFGIKPVSFVFPGNQYGNSDLLKKYGYKIIRYRINKSVEIGFPNILTNGLTAIHDSCSAELSEDGWDHQYILWKLKQYIDKTIRRKAVSHFWFHPSINNDQIQNIFFPLLDELARLRDRGEVEIRTMRELVRIETERL